MIVAHSGVPVFHKIQFGEKCISVAIDHFEIQPKLPIFSCQIKPWSGAIGKKLLLSIYGWNFVAKSKCKRAPKVFWEYNGKV